MFSQFEINLFFTTNIDNDMFKRLHTYIIGTLVPIILSKYNMTTLFCYNGL